MEYLWTTYVLITFFLTILTYYFSKLSKRPARSVKLPPGPPKLPLIGNLHQLASRTTLPHRRLAELAKVHGPLMHLTLGQVPTVVVSSSDMAREVMKTHDAVMCSRPRLMLAEYLFYGCKDVAFAPYGEYWRQVRKIAMLELFTTSRVQSFRPIREGEVIDLARSLAQEAGSVVNLSQKIFTLNFNIILREAVNKKGKDGSEFSALFEDMAEVCSGLSVGDLYPSIEFISTISGFKSKLQRMVKTADKIMDPIIQEHITKKQPQGHNEVDDLVDVLLTFHKGEHSNSQSANDFSLALNSIKAIILEMFGAASETSSTATEWAIAELIKNPRIMKKAQDEVRQVFQGLGKVDETHLTKLKYLKLVIKETLRLHPPFPLLIPRESMESCEINGYQIPPKTRIFINAWAIGMDPGCWSDPENFEPERFEGSPIDLKGMHFELIPFGSGRRICPGLGLAVAGIELTLATLLHHFDWKLPDGTQPDGLGMEETFGIVAKRKNELYVIPTQYTNAIL